MRQSAWNVKAYFLEKKNCTENIIISPSAELDLDEVKVNAIS